MKAGLLRSTLTLLTGSVAAHALPLLLGPALTRVYSPEAYGQFALLWTVSANIAVVGCARYEFALPLETTDEGAATLMALCARILVTVTAAAAAAGLHIQHHRGRRRPARLRRARDERVPCPPCSRPPLATTLLGLMPRPGRVNERGRNARRDRVARDRQPPAGSTAASGSGG